MRGFQYTLLFDPKLTRADNVELAEFYQGFGDFDPKLTRVYNME